MAAVEDALQDWFKGVNYLGRPSSIRLTGETPGDQGGGPATGVLDAGAPPGGGAPAPTGTSGAAPQSSIMPGGTTMSPLIRAFLAAKGIFDKGQSLAQPLLNAPPTGDAGGMLTPSGQWTTTAPEILREMQFPSGGLAGLTPSDYGTAAGAEFGDVAAGAGTEAGAEAGAELAGTVGSQWAGPIFSAMKSFIDFVGEGKVPFQDIINLIAPHTFGPSAAWQSFPSRLGRTLGTEFGSSNTLAQGLLNARPEDVPGLIAAWRSGVGQAIPGFGQNETDPYALTFLPGAGGHSKGASGQGTAHEGFNVDFAPLLAGLASEIQAARRGGVSPQDRISAFQSGMQPLIDAANARKAEQQRIYDEWAGAYDPGTGAP